MKIVKRIFGTVFLLILLAVLAVGVYLYPTARAAGQLDRGVNWQNGSFQADIVLNQTHMTEKQRIFVTRMSGMLGIAKEDLLMLHFDGSVKGDILYTKVYCAGREEAITQIYIDQKAQEAFLDLGMVYDLIREKIKEQLGIFGALVPEWSGGRYMTASQLEQLTGADLGGLQSAKLPEQITELGFWQYFTVLAPMKREAAEGGKQFSVKTDVLDASLLILEPDQPQDLPLALRVSLDLAEEPVITEEQGILGDLQEQIASYTNSAVFSQLNVAISFETVEALSLPEDVLAQEKVDSVAQIWELIKGLQGGK